MRLDRSRVRLTRGKEPEYDKPTPLTKAEAVSFMWELAREVFSLAGTSDVESRLQRHVVSLARKKG
jgi:hypothetical protein